LIEVEVRRVMRGDVSAAPRLTGRMAASSANRTRSRHGASWRVAI